MIRVGDRVVFNHAKSATDRYNGELATVVYASTDYEFAGWTHRIRFDDDGLEAPVYEREITLVPRSDVPIYEEIAAKRRFSL